VKKDGDALKYASEGIKKSLGFFSQYKN